MSEAPLLVLAGPTAIGKTRCATELALRFEGELIGADSVQVYRGFDIGSAKPSREELRGVPHHLIDIRNPDEPIDAGEYAALAREVIADVRSRGKLPIVVGGTGLWLRALTRGLVALPRPDPALRARIESRADEEGVPALYEHLREVDPASAGNLHPNDRVRIVRAIEVYEQTGVPLGVHHARHALGAPRYAHLFIVADLPKELHLQRILVRTRAMLDSGWVEEVRRLRDRWGDHVRAFGSVGYRQVLEHLREDVPLAETERRIVRATRLYSRRQRTWFASEPGVDWRTGPETLLGQQGTHRIREYLLRFTT